MPKEFGETLVALRIVFQEVDRKDIAEQMWGQPPFCMSESDPADERSKPRLCIRAPAVVQKKCVWVFLPHQKGPVMHEVFFERLNQRSRKDRMDSAPGLGFISPKLKRQNFSWGFDFNASSTHRGLSIVDSG